MWTHAFTGHYQCYDIELENDLMSLVAHSFYLYYSPISNISVRVDAQIEKNHHLFIYLLTYLLALLTYLLTHSCEIFVYIKIKDEEVKASDES